MINVKELYHILEKNGITYYTGVPDSTLKNFCDYIMYQHGTGKNHIIAPNEGNAVALAAGHYLVTGEIGLVYMQNSGLGNAVNPITSLVDSDVYGIPLLYMIGWRGQPGTKDEPQHKKQGKITLELLKLLGIPYFVIGKETTIDEVMVVLETQFKILFETGQSAAFVVETDVLEKAEGVSYQNGFQMSRERAIEIIINQQERNDIFVSTTGKISRELFEYREKLKQSHEQDFLTVGSMGHASMIALAIAEETVNRKVYCIDGDGAMIMHLGAVATIGNRQPNNLCHIVLNNGAHETVGGMPTISHGIQWKELVKSCGYREAYQVTTEEQLSHILEETKTTSGSIFIEVMVALGSRGDLGRPTTTAKENKESFMKFLGSEDA